jgi:maltooligosyltrehalose trehalohydrolase
MMEVSVWAPKADRVQVRFAPPGRTGTAEATTTELEPAGEGWFSTDVEGARPGDDYGFLLDDGGQLLPDPRSRRQPEGVHGPSRFYVDDFAWTDQAWAGKDLPDSVFYELHVGTFTPAGTLLSAIERLDHLVALGVTHVELLPVNDFNGQWNWGYDGVLWYAVHEAYGGPDGLKQFVDACHGRGLGVALDVVYNHLGPSGNHLPEFGPYFKEGRNTWGDLINLDGESSGPVRDYILDNVAMWFSEFHVDALRLDAVHALHDESATHLLAEMSERVEQMADTLGRPLILIAESDLNDPVMITPRNAGYGLDAQWDDDVHHALHALLTGERQAYYVDFGPLSVLAKVLTHAFFHDGTYSTFRHADHGKPVDRQHTPGYRFVVCLQNHDQVGNRAYGDRLTELTSAGKLKVGAVLLLTSPFTPMLWMGEEWAAGTRWPFFTSHPEPDLAEATGKGRLAEFADHGWNTSEMVDPQDPQAFVQAKLDWSETSEAGHAGVLGLYRDLIRLRRELPDLRDSRLDQVDVDFDEEARWMVIRRGSLAVMANLADVDQELPAAGGELVLATEEGSTVSDGRAYLVAQSALIARTGG